MVFRLMVRLLAEGSSMGYGISIIFRLIPLVMGIICFGLGLGALVIAKGTPSFIAGHVLISLAAICYALFTTASVIIQQLIKTFNKFWMFVWPITGYTGAIVAIIWGISILRGGSDAAHFVAAHVVIGVGMIALCVSTVAAASSKFTLIPQNANKPKSTGAPETAYCSNFARLLIFVPLACFLIGTIWALVLLGTKTSLPQYFVAGNVLLGLSFICGSLISLVATVVRQVRDEFSDKERWYWASWVMLMGSILIVLGIYYLFSGDPTVRTAPAVVIIGLGMVCYSISSKVWLLALVWRRTCSVANRIPLIPIFTCLFCLFTAAFLVDMDMMDSFYFIPSRVLVGLGAVCFTLFSIVSILEAGTSSHD